MDTYKYFGGIEQDLIDDLSPSELWRFITTDIANVDQTVSKAITESATFENGVINRTAGTFLSGTSQLSALMGNSMMGGGDTVFLLSEGFLHDQKNAAAGDPTATVEEFYEGTRYADPETNNNTSNTIAARFKAFCDIKGKSYRLECTNDAKLDLAIGLQWSNSDTLIEDQFKTGYNFHSTPDALKASVSVRLTPGWEARFDNRATFKIRIIPSWTHSFLYVPLTTLGLRASPILTSEDD